MHFILRFALALALLSQGGCAVWSGTYKAANYQPHVDEAAIELGISLSQVEAILGSTGQPIVGAPMAFAFRYEDTDAWAGRKWIYWIPEAATAMTLPLFLPVEMSIERNAQRWGLAVFDEEGGLIIFRGSRKPVTIVADSEGRLHETDDGRTLFEYMGSEFDTIYLQQLRPGSTTANGDDDDNV